MLLEGTLINAVAILAGTAIGSLLGGRLPERVRQTLMVGLGLATLLIGLQLALQSEKILVVIGALVLGGLIGEGLNIEKWLARFGQWLQHRVSGESNLVHAFVTSSLLYCVGAMAVMGALQDGTGQTPTILYAKSALDGVAAVALTAALGVGVAFSVLPVALYQGGISLLAGWAAKVLTDPVVTEMNAVGGLLIVALSIDLLGLKRLPVGNLLPAIFVAVGLVWAAGIA